MERIEQKSVSLDRLVSELLTPARLETGIVDGLDEDVDVNELVADIVEDAQFDAAGNGCAVEYAANGQPVVKGNAEFLHRAIENVARNAVKYSTPGGRFSIDTHPEPEGHLLRSSISDQDPGIPEEVLDAIFEPFSRERHQVIYRPWAGIGDFAAWDRCSRG